MDWNINKLDDNFDTRTGDPASTDELKEMQRTFPWPLPSTHTFEYAWEYRATPQKPRLLPRLHIGVRELSLADIAERTKNFETLGIAELRHLSERHKVKQPPFVKGDKHKPDVEVLREALRVHYKNAPREPERKAVQVQKPKDAGAVVLPPDIAAMDENAMKTFAARKGLLEEFERLVGKNIAQKRAWLATKTAQKADEPAKELVESAT